jgi:hypothetical protein
MEEKSEVGGEDREIENENSRHESNATSSTIAKGDEKEKEGKGKMMPEKWSLFGLFHRWIGRLAITLAMINGGLGFMLAKEYKPVWSFAGQVPSIQCAYTRCLVYVDEHHELHCCWICGTEEGGGRRWVGRRRFLRSEWVGVYTIGRCEEK